MNILPEPPAEQSTPAQVLHEVFGYSRFRGEQQAIVEHVAGGGDALVLMPTGVGFYYVEESVAFQPIDISGTDVDLSQPTRLGRKKVFQLTTELTGIPAVFAFCRVKRLRVPS
ncbi:MAG: hypothetical protein HKM00_05150 [Gallionella sp.]|nr:hypothetical protein [Gallionella sp.]